MIVKHPEAPTALKHVDSLNWIVQLKMLYLHLDQPALVIRGHLPSTRLDHLEVYPLHPLKPPSPP